MESSSSPEGTWLDGFLMGGLYEKGSCCPVLCMIGDGPLSRPPPVQSAPPAPGQSPLGSVAIPPPPAASQYADVPAPAAPASAICGAPVDTGHGETDIARSPSHPATSARPSSSRNCPRWVSALSQRPTQVECVSSPSCRPHSPPQTATPATGPCPTGVAHRCPAALSCSSMSCYTPGGSVSAAAATRAANSFIVRVLQPHLLRQIRGRGAP